MPFYGPTTHEQERRFNEGGDIPFLASALFVETRQSNLFFVGFLSPSERVQLGQANFAASCQMADIALVLTANKSGLAGRSSQVETPRVSR